MQLVLASESPARLGVLRAAGVAPVVQVSRVDEDALLAGLAHAEPERRVTALAEAKADCVAGRLTGSPAEDSIVIGCDSMLLIDGDLAGKPGTADVARRRWAAMAGRDGHLVTGHALVRVRAGEVVGRAAGAALTRVRFAAPTQAELGAYIASGEPLAVAGGFTLDGLGGWFVESIEGDPSNVIGISLPLTRRLLAQVGVSVVDIWAAPAT
ncbi:Maf family protein [Pseudonocardia sp.]|uniref:Maf family protein n=1 Tax=Pseudonocardia sp. TaxID=60912 RepID=UPI00260953C9|nr:Maf family protein [Pseudonocardia sp.]